jgi:hypothetical protein
MDSRLYTTSVVLAWLASMSWLVVSKVLPAMLVGDPPSYRQIVAAQKQNPPTGWDLSLNGNLLGWSLSMASARADGGTELRGWAHFHRLPLAETAPGWLKSVLRLMEQPLEVPKMDVRSTFTIDAGGRLSEFRSTVRFASMRDEIVLCGKVEGTKMTLAAQTSDFGSMPPTEVYLPPGALVGDTLTPHSKLPGLREGQRWSVPIYSPLHPMQTVEILQASVERSEVIIWGGEVIDCWVVAYRNDAGAGLGGPGPPRGCVWVRHDGTVLKQEMRLFDARLVFVRLTDENAGYLAKRVLSEDQGIETGKSR